jgi:hypothetical protein
MLAALRASLSTRLDALNNKLEQHPEIVYVAPVQIERPPVVKARPSPAEYEAERLEKLDRETPTEEQQERFRAELERIASKDKVTLTVGCDRVDSDDPMATQMGQAQFASE